MKFLWERVRRILIPLIVAFVIVCPVLRFLENANQGRSESFVHFLPGFFIAPNLFAWYHLWFLVYLFATTIVFLPLLIWLCKTTWRVESASRWTVYLFLVPFVIVRMLLSPHWPSTWRLYNDPADFLHYSLFFIAGFMLSRYPAFETAVQKEWKRLILISLAAAALLIPKYAEASFAFISSPELYAALYATAGFCFVMAAAGFARRFADAANVYVGYLREATFPIYIIHYPAITIIAFYVVQLQIAIAVKFAIIILAATALTMLAYHFLVRSVPPVRLLFGLPPRLKRHKAS
jgi:peptidoglycan/LPS O-acetylase OafA/YrhL